MRVAVVGGNLQGVEATYLAHKAGWDVVVLDKDPDVPATGLCDQVIRVNLLTDIPVWSKAIKVTDLIIPALEDLEILDLLRKVAMAEGVPLAYDPVAYQISTSKLRSNRLLADLGLPIPKPWPHCGLPVIVKPSNSSGSRGVERIDQPDELKNLIKSWKENGEDWVAEEYVEGPSYSLEVLGYGGEYRSLEVTEIQVDHQYDCKRVVAPAQLPDPLVQELRNITIKIAHSLQLKGLMDVEVILGPRGFRLLEIDARLPSQTPTAVYHSTGWNMVKMLYDTFVAGTLPDIPEVTDKRAVIYEQIRVSGGVLEVLGEHIISKVGPLRYYEDFFGADEALSNYRPDVPNWVAVLILIGNSYEEVWTKHRAVLKSISDKFSLMIRDHEEMTCQHLE